MHEPTDGRMNRLSRPSARQLSSLCTSRLWALAGLAWILLAACATPSLVDSPAPELSEDAASQDRTEQDTGHPPAPPEPEPESAPEDTVQVDKPPEKPAPPPVEAESDLTATEPPTAEQQPEPIEPEAEMQDQQPEATEPEQAAPEAAKPETQRSEPDRRLTTPQPTQELAGRIRVLQNGREQAFASMYLNQTVVAWMPDQAVAVEPMAERQIVTRQRQFFPPTLVVTSGTPVRFPNMDPIDHNVFSLTPGHRFDVGRYGEGEGRAHVFEGSGMVEILCNLHSNMTAYMLVLETPFFATPDEDGRFSLEGLPDGPGELLVWNYRGSEQVQRLTLDSTSNTDMIQVDVDITRAAPRQRSNQ